MRLYDEARNLITLIFSDWHANKSKNCFKLLLSFFSHTRKFEYDIITNNDSLIRHLSKGLKLIKDIYKSSAKSHPNETKLGAIPHVATMSYLMILITHLFSRSVLRFSKETHLKAQNRRCILISYKQHQSNISVAAAHKWVRIFKNRPSKICGRQPLKIWSDRVSLGRLVTSDFLKAIFDKFYLVILECLDPNRISDL